MKKLLISVAVFAFAIASFAQAPGYEFTIQAIMIWGLYGNFSGSLNELSDCTRKQLPQLIDLFTTMIVTNWVIIAALLFTLFRPNRKQNNC